jgi:hypothetical protein
MVLQYTINIEHKQQHVNIQIRHMEIELLCFLATLYGTSSPCRSIVVCGLVE